MTSNTQDTFTSSLGGGIAVPDSNEARDARPNELRAFYILARADPRQSGTNVELNLAERAPAGCAAGERVSHACHETDTRGKHSRKLYGRHSAAPEPPGPALDLFVIPPHGSVTMTVRIIGRLCAAAAGLALAATTLPLAQQARAAETEAAATTTPIKHVIIVVGENHTFDNLFGTYKPRAGQTIDNLLSKGIVREDGSPGPHFDKAQQLIGRDTAKYHAETVSTGAYATLPQPYTTYGIGLPPGVPDTRFPADLPNGPYQISKYVPYAAYTGDPVHRFFQMWQDVDGGKLDKFVWIEETIGTGSNGAPPPAGGFNPKEGAISMGFYNMNPYKDASGKSSSGDAAIFKSHADQYAISDNYHQAVMGGTGANFQALVAGDAAFFTNTNLDGTAAVPFSNQIENPDPVEGTNNYYTQ